MKLLNLADKTVAGLGLFLFGLLTGVSLFTTEYFSIQYEEIPYRKPDLFFLVLLVCAFLLFFMYQAAKWILKEEEKQEKRIRLLTVLVMLYTLIFGVLWVVGACCIPVGDQASVCTAAEGFRCGDYSMLTRESYEKYLFIHPHQLGLTALIELVFALFGNGNFKAFEFLNCLGATLCVYSGYRITRLLTEDKRAWVYDLLLSVGCFPLFFYVTFVYGELPSLTFSLLAVWMFLSYEKTGKILSLAGLCLSCSLACLIRNNSLILLIAFVLVLLVQGIGKRQWKKFLAVACLLLAFLSSRTALRSFYEERADIRLNEGAPMILYVAMGMQKGEGAPGWSNGYILHAYWGESEFDEEAASAMGMRDIRASLEGFQSDPAYAGSFYLGKFTSQWNDPTYECFAMTHINGWARCGVVNSMYYGKLHALLAWFMNQYQSLIFIGVLSWLLFSFRKNQALENRILLITILGGFFFHMIWEAKGRYILPYFVMMLPMAALGLSALSEPLKNWLQKQRKKG